MKKENNFSELFGLPSCGKSYYINHINDKGFVNVNKKYLLHSNRIIRNIKKLYLFLIFILFEFPLFIQSYKLINSQRFTSRTKKIKMLVYLCTTLYLIKKVKRSKKDNNYCFEEGLLQVLSGICYACDYSEKFINNFLEVYKSYFANYIFYLDTDIEVIKERLLARNDSGGSELEHDYKKNPKVLDYAVLINKKIIDNATKVGLVIERLN